MGYCRIQIRKLPSFPDRHGGVVVTNVSNTRSLSSRLPTKRVDSANENINKYVSDFVKTMPSLTNPMSRKMRPAKSAAWRLGRGGSASVWLETEGWAASKLWE